MSILEAIILGAVQGLTEFLPVSSSGHLQIAKEVLGVTLADNLAFDVMLHVATVMATVVVLWREVAGLFRGVFQFRYNEQTAYVLKILLSMVPIGLVGFLLRDQINAMLSSSQILLIVGAMLVSTAGLLAFAQYAGTRAKAGAAKAGVDGREIGYRDAFVIGLGQAAAAMPGLSRSGTTIAVGLLLGNRKTAVAQFSFLMVILPILGEALLDVVRGDISVVSRAEIWPMVAGFFAAFAVGLASCRFMIEMVKRSKLVWFAAYCAVVGVGSVVWYFL